MFAQKMMKINGGILGIVRMLVKSPKERQELMDLTNLLRIGVNRDKSLGSLLVNSLVVTLLKSTTLAREVHNIIQIHNNVGSNVGNGID